MRPEVAFSDSWGRLAASLSWGWKTGLPRESRSSPRCSDGRTPEGLGTHGASLPAGRT